MDVQPLGPEIHSTRTSTLLMTENMHVIRMVMPAGKEIPEHKAPGEIIIHCMEGQIALTAMGKTEQLDAGQLICLSAGQPHSVHAIMDSSFLLTLLLIARPSVD